MTATTARPLTVLAGALLLSACTHRTGDAPSELRPVTVAATVSAALADGMRTVGLLTPKDEARLGFKVNGVIEAIRVEEGATVKAGQLLALLQQTEVDAVVEQARQAASKANRDLGRGQALYADGVATQEQLEDLTTAAHVTAASLRTAEFNARYARIEAPSDGVVLRKLADAHELVQAGQPVLVVGGSARGWIVRTGLADRDVVRVRVGDEAQVRFDAWPDRAFTGRISNISAAADPGNGTFAVEVRVEPGTEPFVQGLVAKVGFMPKVAAAFATPVVPVEALLEANGVDASVFVVDLATHRARRVAVRIGRLSDTRVEVLDGLRVGDQVVVAGAAFLADGDTVRLVTPPPVNARVGGALTPAGHTG